MSTHFWAVLPPVISWLGLLNDYAVRNTSRGRTAVHGADSESTCFGTRESRSASAGQQWTVNRAGFVTPAFPKAVLQLLYACIASVTLFIAPFDLYSSLTQCTQGVRFAFAFPATRKWRKLQGKLQRRTARYPAIDTRSNYNVSSSVRSVRPPDRVCPFRYLLDPFLRLNAVSYVF